MHERSVFKKDWFIFFSERAMKGGKEGKGKRNGDCVCVCERKRETQNLPSRNLFPK